MRVARQVTCEESDKLRTDDLMVLSSITNLHDGVVFDGRLPPITETVWGHGDTPILRDFRDDTGCQHWLYTDTDKETQP